MIVNNVTPFTGAFDDSACLKQIACIKAPLKTIFNGKAENFQMHINEFRCRMKNTGLLHEFQIKIGENPQPLEIEIDLD
jgi:hypothetical protein